jgi:hypothetical protein
MSMRNFLLSLVAVVAVLSAGCAGLVPTGFKKSEAADGAVLTELVTRHTLNAQVMDPVETWARLAEIAGNAELRNRWLRGESVDWASTVAK